MTERKPIADAVSTIAWACVILHLDLNFWRLNVLGNWIGYWMIADAITKLSAENPETGLLRPLAVGLAVWDGVFNALWLLLGIRVNIYAVNIVVVTMMLYLRFQLLTNLADIAEAHGCPQRRQLLLLRTVQTLLLTVALFLPQFSEGVLAHSFSVNLDFLNLYQHVPAAIIAYGTIAVNGVVVIWILLLLFSLRKSLGWTPPQRVEPPESPPLGDIFRL